MGVDGNNISHPFKLTRYIKDNDWKAEFELHEADKNNVRIIIIRKDSQAYAIPLFTSNQADFWQMDTVHRSDIQTRVNTTFQQELKIANKKLKLSKHDFFFIRYTLQHILLMSEELYPDPCSNKIEMPYQVEYRGSYIFILTVHSRDSLLIKAEPLVSCAYDLNK